MGSSKEDLENSKIRLKTHSEKVLTNLFSALLIWLFGVLVFVPLASSLNWQIRVFSSLTFFVAFTFFVIRVLPDSKKLIDTFAILFARKYALKGTTLSYENCSVLFRYLFYVICAVILYSLYFPFLVSFHPSISGLALILLLLLVFFFALRILPILFRKMLEWLLR